MVLIYSVYSYQPILSPFVNVQQVKLLNVFNHALNTLRCIPIPAP